MSHDDANAGNTANSARINTSHHKQSIYDASSLPQDDVVSSQQTITVNGKTLSYTVTTGTWIHSEESNKEGISEGFQPKARMFFVAYTLHTAPTEQPDPQRPVTFSFNGGPGSSSVWLHLGLLGPRRVVMGDAGEITGPPYQLTDNEFTLLSHSDLVFIDPVTTGYSRPLDGEKTDEFHGYQKDIEAMGDFIRLWTTRSERWLSPKFLIGESYGTLRAAALSGYLQERHGLFLNGLMLVSSILDFSTVDFSAGHDLAYILHLPTYAATAWYHGQLGRRRSLKAVLREAETFTDGAYSQALHLGARQSKSERQKVAETYARLTGLSTEFVLNNDLKISLDRFQKELLRHQGKVVGRLDSRFIGIDRDSGGERPENDPSLTAIRGPYTATFNHYIRAELGYKNDLPYEILSGRVHPWSFKEHENKAVNVADIMRQAIHDNTHLKIYVGSSYFDCATPYHATRHTLDHLQLAQPLRQNIRECFYESGHMMYVHLPSLEQQYHDLVNFVEWTVATTQERHKY